MENSRDSSIWRSLAVAFGDGLAFGVGMKLTQNAGRGSTSVAPPAESGTIPDRAAAERLERLEQRLERFERTPAAALAQGQGAGAFDQKVLEAVVNALDARLNEHTGQVERRLAEFEARMAIELKSLHQQDHSFASAANSRMEEVERQFQEQVAAIRKAVTDDLSQFAEAVSGIVEDRSAAAANAAIDARLAPLRAEVERKNREIADLKQSVADGDRNLLEVVSAISQVCHQAAERIAGPETPPATGGSSPQPEKTVSMVPEKPPSPLNPEKKPDAGSATPPTPQAAHSNGVIDAQIHPLPLRPADLPQSQSRLWRIPLVSSFLMATGGMLLLHYL